MGKNIGIIDADLIDNGTRHPNLALMKISGYYKSLGCNVSLLLSYKDLSDYSNIYISKVFSKTSIPDLSLYNHISFGGTGFFEDGGPNLHKEIEHHMPDYSLYNGYVDKQISLGKKKEYYSDYIDYSIGFTTRGCFRKCEFCVNKKYNKVFRHSSVDEFLDTSRKGIYLWDDNFLGYCKWEEVLDELVDTNKPFQFRQGLDIRLLDKRKAKRLSEVKYKGDFLFAFDNYQEKDLIEKKLRLWKSYSSKATKLYLFCGYYRSDEYDIINLFKRIHILMKFGTLPYVMRHDNHKSSKYRGVYTQIARWCNQPQFYKKMSFREFCEANQYYHANKNTICSAYQVMLDFEKKFPYIAQKYFDLRYEKENEYSNYTILKEGNNVTQGKELILCK